MTSSGAADNLDARQVCRPNNLTPVTRNVFITLIESVENDLLDHRRFTEKSRVAFADDGSEFSHWFKRVVLDSIDDHGYWGNPFASYPEVADLRAIAYILRSKLEGDPELHELDAFGAGSYRDHASPC